MPRGLPLSFSIDGPGQPGLDAAVLRRWKGGSHARIVETADDRPARPGPREPDGRLTRILVPAVASSPPFLFLVLTLDLKVRSCSPSLMEVLGRTGEDPLG